MAAHRKMAATFAVATAAVIITAACGPSNDSRTRSPRSLTDLLLNMRQVTTSGAILQDSFYAEQNLKDVFAAGNVRYVQFCDVNIVSRLKDFPEWIPRLGQSGRMYEAFDVRVRKYRTIDGDFGASIYLMLYAKAAPRPDFDEVERLLGKNWTECPWELPSVHGPVLIPSTRRHGNACIVYKLGRGASRRELRLRFGPDATLDNALAEAGASEIPLWRTETCPK